MYVASSQVCWSRWPWLRLAAWATKTTRRAWTAVSANSSGGSTWASPGPFCPYWPASSTSSRASVTRATREARGTRWSDDAKGNRIGTCGGRREGGTQLGTLGVLWQLRSNHNKPKRTGSGFKCLCVPTGLGDNVCDLGESEVYTFNVYP